MMKEKYCSYAALWFIVPAFLMLAIYPAEASAGAVRGMEICARIIVPSLFPFLVMSQLLTLSGLPRLMEKAASAVGISGKAAVPFILGITGGYPVGAASVAQLTENGSLTREKAERLLPFCNNTGPAFIVGTAGAGIFSSGKVGALLYVSHIFAAAALGLIFRQRRDKSKSSLPGCEPEAFSDALPRSMKNAMNSLFSICCYIVFFSCITALLDTIGIFSSLSGLTASWLGLELRWVRSLFTGILELGSGISSMSGLAATPLNLALCSFILGFGGLAVHCQTLSVVKSAKIKCTRHFAGRILHGFISALFTYFVFTLLQS